MLSTPARTGNTGSPASLSRESPTFRNVYGNGYFRIDQDDRLARLRWVPHDRRTPLVPVDGGAARGPAMAVNRGETTAETPTVPVYPTPVWLGVPGKTGARPTGPVQFVWKLMDFWHLDKPDAARLLGYDPEDIEHISAVLDGTEKLVGRDIKDRIAHLFHIRRTLRSLFRDLDVENDWLREEHALLRGKSPLSLMLAGPMGDLLLAREYVELAAGVR